MAHSCHTYTDAIGAAIYPMARFTTLVKRNKQKKQTCFHACLSIGGRLRPASRSIAMPIGIDVAPLCAYATCAQQIVPSDWFIFPTQVTLPILLTMEGAEALSDNPLSRIHHVCTIVNPRGWILRFTSMTTRACHAPIPCMVEMYHQVSNYKSWPDG